MRGATVRSLVFLTAILLSAVTVLAAPAPAAAGPVTAPAPVLTIAAIAAGADHTCALTKGGGVVCWGNSTFRQLGNGTTTPSSVPVAVSGLMAGVTAIAAGGNHTCALSNRGGVTCWGQNTDGQLGNGTTTQSNVPVAVSGLSAGVTAIAASGRFACAMTGERVVKCWGDNYVGQTGNGVASRSLVPVDVTGRIGGMTAHSGNNHTCAVTDVDGVECWGYNYVGQLGNGTTSKDATFVPVDVSGLQGRVSAISTGTTHTCALTAGRVACWGYNLHGELGNRTRVNSDVPVAVAGLSGGVAAIAAGSGHTCTLASSGGVRCWGANYSDQLGNGTRANSTSAVPVSGLASGVAAIAAGRDHTCAVTSFGGVKCWGANHAGQLGNGTTTSSRVPVDVDFTRAGQTIVAISAGSWHTCALTMAGGVRCWGLNRSGQLGNGTTAGSPTPVDVVGLASRVVAIAAGGMSTCALTSVGGVKCWGANDGGQLGNGTAVDSATPIDVVGLSSSVRAISIGDTHACALAPLAPLCAGGGTSTESWAPGSPCVPRPTCRCARDRRAGSPPSAPALRKRAQSRRQGRSRAGAAPALSAMPRPSRAARRSRSRALGAASAPSTPGSARRAR